MHHTRIADNTCGKYPVPVAVLRRHNAVGGKKHRGRKSGKLFLLVLPCSAEVSFQMRIFSKLRISMGRKHLSMCIDVDAFTLCLLKKQFQIPQVMT